MKIKDTIVGKQRWASIAYIGYSFVASWHETLQLHAEYLDFFNIDGIFIRNIVPLHF